MTVVKTRFCPSPTGLMHLGNVRTALFNALLAFRASGIFLLRIEDTDRLRSETRYTDALLADLRWLGTHWQEGPEVGGDQAPYWQSERQYFYNALYQKLEASGCAYPCFCSEEELTAVRKQLIRAKKPPRYLGTCRSLSAEAIAEKRRKGIQPTLRFRVPVSGATVFKDTVRGLQTFQHRDIGDFVIRRADGTAAFLFCNAVDDAQMGVTQVLRGADHLANTPRQLMILKALDLPAPEYGHISLILGSDDRPLSKRNGSRTIESMRDLGYLPQAIVNCLARLGHHYDEEGKILDFADLANGFSMESLGASPARFDEQQLLYWQKQALATLNTEAVWTWMGTSVQRRVPEEHSLAFVEWVRSNIRFPAEAEYWADVVFGSAPLTQNVQTLAALQAAGSTFFRSALAAYAALPTGADFAAWTHAIQKQTSFRGKALFLPLRLSLTGRDQGPELADLFVLLGDRVPRRLKEALDGIAASSTLASHE